jgi:hypothetical protein
MPSKRKILANHANAGSSTGPKTAHGKNHSRRNAVKHGFFSRELTLSDLDRVELQTMRRTLHSQLQPMTYLQSAALDRIAYCLWWCKLAARLEIKKLNAT